MSILVDLVKFTTATVGTGSIVIGPKVTGFRSMADAGLTNGARVSYGIEDGVNREVGHGVYSTGTNTLTRELTASTSGALLNLSGNAVVYITALGDDIARGKTIFLTAGGGSTANAMVVNSDPNVPVSALNAEDTYIVQAPGPNTVTNPQINVNGKGNKTIVTDAGAALSLAAWPSGSHLMLRYDGANMRLVGRLRGSGFDPVVPCDVNTPNGGRFLLTTKAGYQVSDQLQSLTFKPATNNTAAPVASHPDFFAGAEVPILLENGSAAPAGAIRNGYKATLSVRTAISNAFILSEPGFNQQMAIIPLVTASTGSVIVATLAENGAKYNAFFGEGFMMASFIANADKPAGGGQLTITGVIGPVAIFDFDGVTALDVGAWKKGSLVIVTRIPTGQTYAGNFRLVYVGMPMADIATVLAGLDTRSPVNSAGVAAAIAQSVESVGRARYLIDEELIGGIRNVKIWRPNARRLIIETRTFPADYRGIYAGSQMYEDRVRYEMMNLSGWYHTGQTSTELWVLTSIVSFVAGKRIPHMNYTFDAVIGSTADNGQIFSVNSPVIFFGPTGASVASVSATNGQGPGHGYINAISGTFNVYGGVKNGQPIPDGSDILNGFYQLKPGDPPIFATYVQQNALWDYLYPDNVTKGMRNTVLRTWGNGRQLRTLFSLAFEPGAQMLFGYAGMLKYRLPTRFLGRDKDGVAYAPRTTGLKDNHQEIFTNVKSLIGFYEPPAGTPDTSYKGHGLEWKIVDSYVPYRLNGSEPGTYTPVPIVTDEDSGPAFRSQTWGGSTDFEPVGGDTYAFMTDIAGVRTDAA